MINERIGNSNEPGTIAYGGLLIGGFTTQNLNILERAVRLSDGTETGPTSAHWNAERMRVFMCASHVYERWVLA